MGYAGLNGLCFGTQIVEAALSKAFSLSARLEDILKAAVWTSISTSLNLAINQLIFLQ